MCILFIAINQHPHYPLVIAANRDEFHERATQQAHFWDANKNLLAGKDLVAGGTWMGITTAGKIAALTNIRAPGQERDSAITRGELVANFLNKTASQKDYLQTLKDSHLSYNGYNLLFGKLTQLQVYNSFEDAAYELEDGVYGLSNASLNSPWPKLDIGRSALADYCKNADELNHEHLFELLNNNLTANDDDLPDTGISKDWEKMLSSIFIVSPQYGTRSSTILLIDNNHQAYWEERSFSTTGEINNTVVHKFKIQE